MQQTAYHTVYLNTVRIHKPSYEQPPCPLKLVASSAYNPHKQAGKAAQPSRPLPLRCMHLKQLLCTLLPATYNLRKGRRHSKIVPRSLTRIATNGDVTITPTATTLPYTTYRMTKCYALGLSTGAKRTRRVHWTFNILHATHTLVHTRNLLTRGEAFHGQPQPSLCLCFQQ